MTLPSPRELKEEAPFNRSLRRRVATNALAPLLILGSLLFLSAAVAVGVSLA